MFIFYPALSLTLTQHAKHPGVVVSGDWHRTCLPQTGAQASGEQLAKELISKAFLGYQSEHLVVTEIHLSCDDEIKSAVERKKNQTSSSLPPDSASLIGRPANFPTAALQNCSKLFLKNYNRCIDFLNTRTRHAHTCTQVSFQHLCEQGRPAETGEPRLTQYRGTWRFEEGKGGGQGGAQEGRACV